MESEIRKSAGWLRKESDNNQMENEKTEHADRRKPGGANLDHLVSLSMEPNSKYLRLDVAVGSLHIEEKDEVENGILDTLSTYLHSTLQSITSNLATSATQSTIGQVDNIKPTSAVNHMRFLESRPDDVFLRQRGGVERPHEYINYN